MVDFATSTQKQHWTFSPKNLLGIRTKNRAKSIATTQKVCAEIKQEDNGHESNKKQADAASTAISLEEESLLCRFYQTKIQEICRMLRFPHKVQATALLYFKRFFLRHTTLDHDPKDIMLTVIYLACKIEESYIGAEEFGKIVKQKPDIVLRLEFTLLQALNFDLVTYAPYKALEGYFLDLETCRSSGEGGGIDSDLRSCPDEAIDKAQGAARSAADLLMLSDAPLIFTPGQLALAAMRSGFKKAGVSLRSYIRRVALKASGVPQDMDDTAKLHKLEASLTDIDSYGMKAAQPVLQEQVTMIDRKLKSFHNPLLDPNSDEYRKAAATKDAQRNKKREQKVQSRQAQRTARADQILGSAQAAQE